MFSEATARFLALCEVLLFHAEFSTKTVYVLYMLCPLAKLTWILCVYSITDGNLQHTSEGECKLEKKTTVFFSWNSWRPV